MADVEIKHAESVATVKLNRPDSHNAMTPAMMAALTTAFQALGADDAVRLIVLTGNGRSFCAGADINNMKAAGDATYAENVADAQAIFDLMLAVDSCPRPVIGRVNGAAIGGGAGLVSCCDSVVAVERATFAFSETRLGLIPAVISPFVLAKIGAGYARELFLSGERFKAPYARHIGLVHHVAVDEAELDALVAGRVEQFLAGAPEAQTAAKAVIRTVNGRPKEEMRDYTATQIAHRRESSEGREGMAAFLEKREPEWRKF